MSGNFAGRHEHRQLPLGVEVHDLERQRLVPWHRPRGLPWRRDGVLDRRRLAELNLGRSDAAEALRRPEGRVVAEGELGAGFEVSCRERRPKLNSEQLLERAPETLDDRDRSVLTDGPETLADRKGVEGLAKHRRRELRSLVADEVPRPTVLLHRPIEDLRIT